MNKKEKRKKSNKMEIILWYISSNVHLSKRQCCATYMFPPFKTSLTNSALVKLIHTSHINQSILAPFFTPYIHTLPIHPSWHLLLSTDCIQNSNCELNDRTKSLLVLAVCSGLSLLRVCLVKVNFV